MLFKVDKTGSLAEFAKLFQQISTQAQTKGVLILSCDANNFSPDDVDAILKESSLPVFGGIFPELINGKEKLTQGTIMVGLTVEPKIAIIEGLSNPSVNYGDLIFEKFPDLGDAKTMFVMVDGFSSRIAALIDSLFDIFGLEVNYIGGGAGSLSFEQKPCLFSNAGLIQDSAILALANLNSGIGVSHGWNSISGPFKVTEVEGNIIKTLDWQPAFEVYRQVVEDASGKTFTNDNFFDISKGYPFGINKIGAEKIVRDPISRQEDGSLVCVGEVPPNSLVDILSGDLNSLITAAGNAYQRGKDAYKGDASQQTAFFIDCISRVLFLEDDFEQELNKVFDENIPLVGALTLGEIANNGKDYLEFYNKTAVIGILEG